MSKLNIEKAYTLTEKGAAVFYVGNKGWRVSDAALLEPVIEGAREMMSDPELFVRFSRGDTESGNGDRNLVSVDLYQMPLGAAEAEMQIQAANLVAQGMVNSPNNGRRQMHFVFNENGLLQRELCTPYPANSKNGLVYDHIMRLMNGSVKDYAPLEFSAFVANKYSTAVLV